MNKLILILLLTICNSCFSQIIVKNTTYFDGEGVIFNDTSYFPFKINDFYCAIKIDSSDVALAEKVLFDTLCLNKKILSKKMYKWMRKHNRQYLGYKKSTSNDKYIIITLLNFYNNTNAEKYFADWKIGPILGFGKFFEENTATLFINIDKGTLTE